MIRQYRLPRDADFQAFCAALGEPLRPYQLETRPSPRGASIQTGAAEVGTVKQCMSNGQGSVYIFLRQPYEGAFDAIGRFVRERYQPEGI